MRKPTFCKCENKDADQLCGNREADQRLCFRYTDSTIPLLSKSQISSLFCSCIAWFMLDHVRNQNVGFLVTQLTILLFSVQQDPHVVVVTLQGSPLLQLL